MADESDIYHRREDDGEDGAGGLPEYSVTAIRAGEKINRSKAHSNPLAKNNTAHGLRRRPLSTQRALTRPAPDRRGGISERIIGSSPEIKSVRDKILQYAPEDAPACIFGESGVGKELVARELHRYGRRNTETFLPINAGAIPEALAPAELFGHQKGAFTGAHVSREGAFLEANGGVLYLDEIGEMAPSIQAQLLRVLDDGKVAKIGSRSAEKVDIRLITATNKDLRASVAEGEFRKDLYYRINVLPIYVPPLRERSDDVIEIADAIIRNHATPEYRNAVLTPRACDRLKAHGFPGNVRELRNLVLRAVVHARGGKILPDHLEFDFDACGDSGEPMSIREGKELVSRYLACRALRASDGKVAKAMKLTGLKRDAFSNVRANLDGKNYAAEEAEIRKKLKALLNI